MSDAPVLPEPTDETVEAHVRAERNRLAEAFIRGLEVGADEPWLAGDGDAMYDAFRRWVDGHTHERSHNG